MSKEMGFLNNANRLYTIDISCSLFSHLRRFTWFQIVFLPVFHPTSQKAWASGKGNMANDTQEQKWEKSTIWWKPLVEASEAWDPGIGKPALELTVGKEWERSL